MTVLPPLSVLDLATVEADGTIADALAHSVALAQTAEQQGYTRIWYAEHHNMPSIASSATAVLIAHIASQTQRIRAPRGRRDAPEPRTAPHCRAVRHARRVASRTHSPRPGRAPGTDGATFRALRRTHEAAERFPSDVLELQQYLSEDLPRATVNAYPGRGTRVPLTILGSSLFGAQLAAQLGLPYSFASHFAPQLLTTAVQHYRANYVPSAAHPTPYVSAGVNVVAAETDEAAERLFARAELDRVRRFLSRGRDQELTADEAAPLLDTPAGIEIRNMLTHTAIGGPERVRAELAAFAKFADVDELVTVHAAPTREEQLASVRFTVSAA